MSAMKTVQRGVYSASRGKCRLWTGSNLWEMAGRGGASVMAVVFTCNTYSVPYKGKSPKKRLSPKSLNTLIHQCITFYVFLIFQYLSLWKSVFSHN